MAEMSQMVVSRERRMARSRYCVAAGIVILLGVSANAASAQTLYAVTIEFPGPGRLLTINTDDGRVFNVVHRLTIKAAAPDEERSMPGWSIAVTALVLALGAFGFRQERHAQAFVRFKRDIS
jgi:hypothetical protein